MEEQRKNRAKKMAQMGAAAASNGDCNKRIRLTDDDCEITYQGEASEGDVVIETDQASSESSEVETTSSEIDAAIPESDATILPTVEKTRKKHEALSYGGHKWHVNKTANGGATVYNDCAQ